MVAGIFYDEANDESVSPGGAPVRTGRQHRHSPRAHGSVPAARHAGRGAAPKQEKVFPVGSSWIAVSLNGKTFSGERPSFTLDQQFRAKGFGGCNTYSATAYPLQAAGPRGRALRDDKEGL